LRKRGEPKQTFTQWLLAASGRPCKIEPVHKKQQRNKKREPMPDLVFHGDEGNASVSLGEALEITLRAGKLSVGGATLASHHEGSWWIGNIVIPRITCDGPIQLLLCAELQATPFGPFTDLVIGANTIWTAQGPVARYSAFTSTWIVETKTREPGTAGSAIQLLAA
jgi:hypothetical protein